MPVPFVFSVFVGGLCIRPARLYGLAGRMCGRSARMKKIGGKVWKNVAGKQYFCFDSYKKTTEI